MIFINDNKSAFTSSFCAIHNDVQKYSFLTDVEIKLEMEDSSQLLFDMPASYTNVDSRSQQVIIIGKKNVCGCIIRLGSGDELMAAQSSLSLDTYTKTTKSLFHHICLCVFKII